MTHTPSFCRFRFGYVVQSTLQFTILLPQPLKSRSLCLPPFLFHILKIKVMFIYLCLHTHVCACGGQRATCMRRFLPSTMRVSGTLIWVTRLGSKCLCLWSHFFCPAEHFFCGHFYRAGMFLLVVNRHVRAEETAQQLGALNALWRTQVWLPELTRLTPASNPSPKASDAFFYLLVPSGTPTPLAGRGLVPIPQLEDSRNSHTETQPSL